MIQLPTKEKEEIIQEYLDGNSIEAIKSQYHHDYKVVQTVIKDAGIDIHKRSRYKCNYHMFDTIDTEEKAYWLGMLFADGYVYEPKHSVSLSLQSSDVDCLYSLQKFFETDTPVHTYPRTNNTEMSELTIYNKHLYEQVVAKGCIPRKTGKVVFPKCVPSHLVRHFIRGYFDGNGWITHITRQYKTKHPDYTFGIASTKEMLCEIYKYLPTNKKRETPCMWRTKRCEAEVYHMTFGGNLQVIKILDYLYNNATVYLQRKHDRYLLLKNMYS